MKRKQKSITNKLYSVVLIVFLLLLWQVLSISGLIPDFMLPSPKQVVEAFCREFPVLISHSCVTLSEAFLGLGLGIAMSFALALLMERFSPIRKSVYPLLVISQTIPVVAIAPLLVLWLGYGTAPKITLVVMTCFFPITVALLGGFGSADRDAILLLRAMGANEWQVWWHVKLPAAIPSFFSGLKISVSYSVVSAVIAEWLGGSSGLGVYMTRVRKAYAFDKMFAVIFWVILISLLLIWLVNVLERKAKPWEKPQ